MLQNPEFAKPRLKDLVTRLQPAKGSTGRNLHEYRSFERGTVHGRVRATRHTDKYAVHVYIRVNSSAVEMKISRDDLPLAPDVDEAFAIGLRYADEWLAKTDVQALIDAVNKRNDRSNRRRNEAAK